MFRSNDTSPWIQVDLGKLSLISGLVTQGDTINRKFVKTYTVYTSIDGKTFVPYSDIPGAGIPKVFSANKDGDTPIRNLFNRNITAQYIRVYPQSTSAAGTAIRLNILGCNPSSPVQPTPSGTQTPGKKIISSEGLGLHHIIKNCNFFIMKTALVMYVFFQSVMSRWVYPMD